MQTIRITITSKTPADILLKEQKSKKLDVVQKIAKLLKKSNSNKEVLSYE